MRSAEELVGAEQLVGIVTAASEALEGGFVLAEPSIARESASQASRAAAAAPEVVREAKALRDVVPRASLQIVADGVARHWRAYEEALANASSKEQIRSIHFALLACLNRELEALRDYEPNLPPGVMKRWWVEYGPHPLHTRLSAVATGSRAARIAGKMPPTNPMSRA